MFGDDVRDAAVTEDLLVIVTNSVCRYYDLHWIIKNVSYSGISYMNNACACMYFLALMNHQWVFVSNHRYIKAWMNASWLVKTTSL